MKSKMCSDKNCQENINMWPVIPEMNMQLPKPAVQYQYRRLCNDKNCQSTRCYKKRNYNKNCQSDSNMCRKSESARTHEDKCYAVSTKTDCKIDWDTA